MSGPPSVYHTPHSFGKGAAFAKQRNHACAYMHKTSPPSHTRLGCAYGEGQGRETLSRALPRGPGPPWIPIFLEAEKGVGASLYGLPNVCHADSLIPAGRFFRKEKSSLLRAGDFLRRIGSFYRGIPQLWIPPEAASMTAPFDKGAEPTFCVHGRSVGIQDDSKSFNLYESG